MQSQIKPIQAIERIGTIEQVIGLKIVAHGPPHTFIGEVCDILDHGQQVITQAEVIGFDHGKVFLMPFDKTTLRLGQKVRATGHAFSIDVGSGLLGTVVDAFAKPLDPKIKLIHQYSIVTHNKKINPLIRPPIKELLPTGLPAIDGLIPLGVGQRMGLFAGSGVGKTTLLGTLVRNSESEVYVIALIGERGREVNEFIQQFLDTPTFEKSVLVVACSDETALMRRQAAYTATAIAEFFCQQGKQVMLVMDSITRFAMAQREIRLSLGEPPTARGYTPSVFSLLPGLIERAGKFEGQGSITALYTVLVEGDDFNEPLADHMRALLDGHIVLTRSLAQQGHYPPIAILQSISRLSKQLFSATQLNTAQQITALLNTYQQNKDLVELGAYKTGMNKTLDYALERIAALNQLLTHTHPLSLAEIMQRFEEILR